MYQRLHGYLFRQMFLAFLFSGLAVTFVVLFTQSFRMLSFIIENSGTLVVFFQLMGLMVPAFLPLILPISVGIAVLFMYHKFTVDSELVVMRASGLHPLSLAAPALALAVSVVLVGGLLTLWATPAANRVLVSLQYKVRDNYSALMIRPGAFNDLAEGLTFYARRRGAGGSLKDILVHDVRNPQRPVTIMAENGLFAIVNGAPQVMIFDGKRQEVDVASGRLQQLDFDRYVLDLQLLKSGKDVRLPDPRELTMTQLIKSRSTPNITSKGRAKIDAEIHQRLASPFLALTFAIIGVTVILLGDFNRRGMTRRVLWASAFIVIIQAAMIGLVSHIGKAPWIAPLLYVIIFAPIVYCYSLLQDARFPILFGRKGKANA